MQEPDCDPSVFSTKAYSLPMTASPLTEVTVALLATEATRPARALVLSCAELLPVAQTPGRGGGVRGVVVSRALLCQRHFRHLSS